MDFYEYSQSSIPKFHLIRSKIKVFLPYHFASNSFFSNDHKTEANWSPLDDFEYVQIETNKHEYSIWTNPHPPTKTKEKRKHNKTYMNMKWVYGTSKKPLRGSSILHLQKQYYIRNEKTGVCQLTLSGSQTLTVLSAEDVASLDMLGLKRTSVIPWECSSSVDFIANDSAHHNTACTTKSSGKRVSVVFSILKKNSVEAAFHCATVCSTRKMFNKTIQSNQFLTFLSCPPVASNFPSDEKWQHSTLLALAGISRISVNVKPNIKTKTLNPRVPLI